MTYAFSSIYLAVYRGFVTYFGIQLGEFSDSDRL